MRASRPAPPAATKTEEDADHQRTAKHQASAAERGIHPIRTAVDGSSVHDGFIIALQFLRIACAKRGAIRCIARVEFDRADRRSEAAPA